eukprot:3710393-Amphidinium_carterae.5
MLGLLLSMRGRGCQTLGGHTPGGLVLEPLSARDALGPGAMLIATATLMKMRALRPLLRQVPLRVSALPVQKRDLPRRGTRPQQPCHNDVAPSLLPTRISRWCALPGM